MGQPINQCSSKLINIEKNYHENVRVSHLPRVDWVQNSPNNFDLNPMTLTYDLDLDPGDLDPDPCDLDLGPSFLKLS